MKKKLSILTLLCLVLGAIFGFFLQDKILQIEFLGSFYVNALKLLILPVLFTSITTTIYESSKTQGKLVGKAIVLFVIMFITSFVVSSIVVFVLKPSANFHILTSNAEITTTTITWTSILTNLFPTDLLGIFMGKSVFFIILVSYLIGYCASKFQWTKFIDGVNVIKKYVFLLLEYITYYTPIAVFSLMGVSVYRFGLSSLLTGLRYIVTAYCAGIVVLVVVMLIPLKLFKKIPLSSYIKKIYPIWLMTISTCSSAATLPYTLKVCKEELKADEKTVDIVVPLGTTIHMCGGAVSFSLLGIFCAQLFGVNITFGLFLMMLVSSILINMAAPGIPGGGVVIGATYLQGLGIPLDFIGFYSGIYKILDMLYTTLNVTGDISAVVLLDKN